MLCHKLYSRLDGHHSFRRSIKCHQFCGIDFVYLVLCCLVLLWSDVAVSVVTLFFGITITKSSSPWLCQMTPSHSLAHASCAAARPRLGTGHSAPWLPGLPLYPGTAPYCTWPCLRCTLYCPVLYAALPRLVHPMALCCTPYYPAVCTALPPLCTFYCPALYTLCYNASPVI